jgi:hypothetical protein
MAEVGTHTKDKPEFAKPDVTRGRNVSGRTWKPVTTKRSSTLVKNAKNNLVKSFEERQAEKLRRKETLELQKQLTEERVQISNLYL